MINFALLLRLFEKLKSQGSLFVLSESLTGGLISSEFSKIPGASAVLWGGFVVYSPYAKLNLLKIPEEVIQTYGVVSKECALEMAKGALKTSYIKGRPFPSYSLAVTGLAGPATKYDLEEVGTVCVAVAQITKLFSKDLTILTDSYISSFSEVFHFEGDRDSIREETLNNGIELLLSVLA